MINDNQKPSESITSDFDPLDAQLLQSSRDSPVVQQPVTTSAPPMELMVIALELFVNEDQDAQPSQDNIKNNDQGLKGTSTESEPLDEV